MVTGFASQLVLLQFHSTAVVGSESSSGRKFSGKVQRLLDLDTLVSIYLCGKDNL